MHKARVRDEPSVARSSPDAQAVARSKASARSSGATAVVRRVHESGYPESPRETSSSIIPLEIPLRMTKGWRSGLANR